MNDLFGAAREIADFMAQRQWRFCIIGGLAVQRWGEPRTTLDADMVLLADWGSEESYVTAILERFPSRLRNGKEFALSHRVILIRASNGKDVDISLGALPFEMNMVQRAVPVEFAPGIKLPCCTAEDLIVMKAFASRPRDWSDIESVLARQTTLNKPYVLENLRVLSELKGDDEFLRRAERLLSESQ